MNAGDASCLDKTKSFRNNILEESGEKIDSNT